MDYVWVALSEDPECGDMARGEKGGNAQKSKNSITPKKAGKTHPYEKFSKKLGSANVEDGAKKKHDEINKAKEAKKFTWKKKDSATSKKPWQEMAETEEEMKKENQRREKDQKLHRVVHEHH